METKALFLLTGLCLASFAAQAALIGDWEFNDATTGTTPTSAVDSSGNGYTLYGPAAENNLTQGMYWTSGQGAGSNGAMHYAGGGNGGSENAGYLIYDAANVTLGDSGRVTTNVYWLGGVSGCIYGDRYSSTARHYLYLNSDGSVNFNDRWWQSVSTVSTEANAVKVNKWTQISVTWSNATSTANLFINGALTATNTSFTTYGGFVDRVVIGADPYNAGGTWGHAFNGNIDYVQLYDTIPEPASLALLALGGVVFLRRRR